MNNSSENALYGVRWKLCADDGLYYDSPCERLCDALGLSVKAYDENTGEGGFSDFDRIYPWSEIKRCVLSKDENGNTRVSYDLKEKGDIFVEIPKHYIKREVKDGYEYRYISAVMREGFMLDPSFSENGKELDFIYVSAYELNSVGGSSSGEIPLYEKTRREFRELIKSNGRGYALFDLRTLLTLQNLYLIEFADRNCQNTIGGGVGKMLQPAVRYMSLCDEKATNRIVISELRPATIHELFVNSRMLICGKDGVSIYNRLITDIQTQDGKTVITFDGEPVDITSEMYVGASPWKTGSTDRLSYHTGQTVCIGGDDANKIYRSGVKYRGMENLWGNVWCHLDGINIRDNKTYICNNIEDYSDGMEGYEAHGIEQEVQTSNDGIAIPAEVHYIKNLGFDRERPWLALPESSVGIEKDLAYSEFLRNNSFGDYYYLGGNPKIDHYVHGGGFDHYWRCGLFTIRGWIRNEQAWYLYGARSIYKPL